MSRVADRQDDRRISLAITGASGFQYGWRLLGCLLAAGCEVHLLVSRAARVVAATEADLKIPAAPTRLQQMVAQHFGAYPGVVCTYGEEDWFSPMASGSAAPESMVICPCSTGTLSAIATGASNNLLERAADVVLKERGTLILVPRETPLATIHLEHMLALSRQGVVILPAAPGFYHGPQGVDDLIDFIVARILKQLGLAQNLVPRWGYGTAHKGLDDD